VDLVRWRHDTAPAGPADAGDTDWIDAAYGDVLYDVAWLDFWGVGMDFAGAARRHDADRGVAVPGYDERLRCYQAFVGLDASRFFAKAGNEGAYRWTRDRLRELGLDGA
jgi:hygromycin-B 4-O-kinase